MSGADSPAPFRIAFDNARDPYTARNALGITSSGGGGGGGAPTDAQYITAASDPTLTNERVLTNTATVTWDFSTAGQAKATATGGGGGGGNVSNSGMPTVGQYAKWVTSTTIQGVSSATVLSDIGAAPLASPTFTGDPKAPTPATVDNDTSIATTAYVQAQGYLTAAAATAAYQPLDADLTAIAALTGTNTIYYRSAANVWSAVTVSTGLSFSGGVLTATGGGGGTPGGADTQVQYNNAGAFGGAANLTWNNATSVLTLTGQLAINLGSATSILAAGTVEGVSFRCAGGVAVLGPTSAGTVALRPSGIASATGQLQVASTGAVTSAGPVNLPADPTTALQAATKQYVDGKIAAPSSPQGRLTLQTATPVMTTTQSAKTSIFYALYCGNLVPIWDGATMTMTTFAELSNVTTATSVNKAGPAAVAANSVYDLFVWNDAGTVRLTRGTAWTNDTTRSAGTALVRQNGIWLNNAAITNGPAASRGTYVGTVRSNGSSQIDWIIGGAAAGGTAGFLGVWNAYNKVQFSATVVDTTASWSYTGNSWRNVQGSAGNRISAVNGLAEYAVDIVYQIAIAPQTGGDGIIGVSVDGAAPTSYAYTNMTGALLVPCFAHYVGVPAIGFHTYQAQERSPAAIGTTTFWGTASSAGVAMDLTGQFFL